MSKFYIPLVYLTIFTIYYIFQDGVTGRVVRRRVASAIANACASATAMATASVNRSNARIVSCKSGARDEVVES